MCLAGLALPLATLAPAADAEAAPLLIGVAPHTSARVILEMYQPLRRHLEAARGVSVEVATSPTFDDLARRGLAGAYDVAVTAGHQARPLQVDAGHEPGELQALDGLAAEARRLLAEPAR